MAIGSGGASRQPHWNVQASFRFATDIGFTLFPCVRFELTPCLAFLLLRFNKTQMIEICNVIVAYLVAVRGNFVVKPFRFRDTVIFIAGSLRPPIFRIKSVVFPLNRFAVPSFADTHVSCVKIIYKTVGSILMVEIHSFVYLKRCCERYKAGLKMLYHLKILKFCHENIG